MVTYLFISSKKPLDRTKAMNEFIHENFEYCYNINSIDIR